MPRKEAKMVGLCKFPDHLVGSGLIEIGRRAKMIYDQDRLFLDDAVCSQLIQGPLENSNLDFVDTNQVHLTGYDLTRATASRPADRASIFSVSVMGMEILPAKIQDDGLNFVDSIGAKNI